MIKIENVVLASPGQMDFIIQGMRNPMNSHGKSDSENKIMNEDDVELGYEPNYEYIVGENDLGLMNRLAKAGTDHRKFMRMMPVYVRITAPLYFYKELETYKIGTVSNSCSTMYKIAAKNFVLDDFSHEHLSRKSIDNLEETIETLNHYRNIYLNGGRDYISDSDDKDYKPKDKYIWWQMIQILPSSYNQTRNIMLNYEVLANIYKSRKTHKLDEWREFCKLIETLPYSELITGGI